MRSVNVPRGVQPLVRIRNVVLPGVVIGLLTQLAVAYAGNPETLSETLPVKPPKADAATVYNAVWPR
jgi:hypothetical protein